MGGGGVDCLRGGGKKPFPRFLSPFLPGFRAVLSRRFSRTTTKRGGGITSRHARVCSNINRHVVSLRPRIRALVNYYVLSYVRFILPRLHPLHTQPISLPRNSSSPLPCAPPPRPTPPLPCSPRIRDAFGQADVSRKVIRKF